MWLRLTIKTLERQQIMLFWSLLLTSSTFGRVFTLTRDRRQILFLKLSEFEQIN